ncbi:hypothetical protein [Rhodococcus jostii]|uniref:hypothetical protein n=1 Tax=Rhodococcus jostii TaxID=132919 RepID=UPI00362CCD68
MRTNRPPVKCLTANCGVLTRSSTKMCPDHRPALSVIRNRNGVSVLGKQLTAQQAYDLASRIADALEGAK